MSNDGKPMTLGDLLDQIRDQYLAPFRAAISEQAGAEPPSTFVAEPILRDEDGEPAREGGLDLPMRGDLFILKDEPEGRNIDSEALIGFDPVNVAGPNGLAVTFTPFVWDMLDVTLGGVVIDDTDWTPLVDWFDRWFDEEEAHPVGPDGLSGVIHGLSEPADEDDAVVFTVDLGSAPVEALEELIEALALLGAASCRFGTPHEAVEVA